MSRNSLFVPMKNSKSGIRLDPIQDNNKHIRLRKTFKADKGGKAHFTSMRLCNSLSPSAQIADFYLGEIDNLCENTRKNIECVRSSVNGLSLKLGKVKICPDDFQERRDDLISQCQEFVYERKFTLKTQQEFLVTKKLQRSVTKKMLGE